MRWRPARNRGNTQERQAAFAFVRRRESNERLFRRAILGFTLLVVTALIAGTATGRYLARRAALGARDLALRAIGGARGRPEIEAEWRARRQYGIELTQGKLKRMYASDTPAMRRLLDAAGMAPDSAIVRWGNFDWTLLLSSKVFENDDNGRSYRLRPNLGAVWLKVGHLPDGLEGFFLVPDTPEMMRALEGTGFGAVPGSNQTTNSWGCRGKEPNPAAALRGIVLGDSMMQGLLVGDDDTPSLRLERRLIEGEKTTVSVLNTGHLGYSPEQYYFTLLAYAGRFPPHFVVVSVCENDFGGGDWSESAYWLGQIHQYCRSHGVICLTVPAPADKQVGGRRLAGSFQGRLSNLSESSSPEFLDPMEDFVNETLRLMFDGPAGVQKVRPNPLFNGHLGDGHFSPQGAEVWARAVARRLGLLLKRRRWDRREDD